ncbi:MAG: hypothetical protein K0U68_01920 [Gammaproteobacteria bacterium]|nr:hypothetical protein [Gammaproteobacteria bacterium]
MANLFERMFIKEPVTEQSEVVNNTAQHNQASDSLTGVARYLQKLEPVQETAPDQQQPVQVQGTEKQPSGVDKYVESISKPELTGVERYIISQIVPEFETRAEEAAKASVPTGVESYLAKIAEQEAENQPAVPSAVDRYLEKIN